MKKKKVIILGTLGTAALVAATVIPIVLINQKKDEKTVEKDNVVYSNKLKALSEKSVKIIALNTESVTDKKAEILAAIKLLTNFPKLPTGITLEVKDDSTKIVSNKEVDVTLIVKKDGETNIEIKGFKVRSFTDQEMVDDYAKKLEAFATKEVQIPSITGTITGKKSEIITSLKALKDFPKLPNDVTLDVKDDSTSLTLQPAEITLIVKKGSVNKEVQGFSAIRSATDQEKVNVFKGILLAAFTVFDNLNPNLKYLKIESSGSVTDNKNAILMELKKYGSIDSSENPLLNDQGLMSTGIELAIKDDSTTITKEGIPIVVQLKKGAAVAEFDGAGGSFQFFVKKILTQAESNTEIKNYLSPTNNKIFIPHTVSTTTAEEILMAVKNVMGNNVSEETKNLFAIKAGQPTLLNAGEQTSIEYDFGTDTITILVTRRTSDAQAIIDYFAQNGKKDLSIPSTTAISNKAELTTAIQAALKADDSNLFDDTKKTYVTLAEDYTYSSFTKGVAKDIKVQIQKDSETPEFITLSVMHNTSDFEAVINYFSTNREFFIPHLAPTSNATEIFNAFVDVVASELTTSQINLINVTPKPNPVQSLVDGAKTSINYMVGGGRGEITFSITKRSADAQAIIDYFAQSGKKNLSILPETVISNKTSLTTAIQEALEAKKSSWINNTTKTYITVAEDHIYSQFTKGVPKDVKVKIQKGSETPEFITLSIIHNTSDFDFVKNYFDYVSEFFIPNSTSTSSAKEILNALKVEIGSELTTQQKNLINIKVDQPISLDTGRRTAVVYTVTGGRDEIQIWITKRSFDAQAIIDYFAQSGKKDLSIPSATVISNKAKLTTAIQAALKADDSALFDDTKKTYVTVASGYVYSEFTKGVAKDVKIKIQKDSETPEFITLSIMHNTSDFEAVINYFSTNREFFIPHLTPTSSAAEIFNAFSDVVASELTASQINLINRIWKPNPVQSLVDGTKTSITYIVGGGRGEITFSITKRSADAQAIIDYFAQIGKKNLSIPSATAISDKATLTTAIQEALKADDSALFDDTKKTYVTIASDYAYNGLTKGTAKDVKVQIQKGSETPEFITLSVTHLQNTSDSS